MLLNFTHFTLVTIVGRSKPRNIKRRTIKTIKRGFCLISEPAKSFQRKTHLSVLRPRSAVLCLSAFWALMQWLITATWFLSWLGVLTSFASEFHHHPIWGKHRTMYGFLFSFFLYFSSLWHKHFHPLPFFFLLSLDFAPVFARLPSMCHKMFSFDVIFSRAFSWERVWKRLEFYAVINFLTHIFRFYCQRPVQATFTLLV